MCPDGFNPIALRRLTSLEIERAPVYVASRCDRIESCVVADDAIRDRGGATRAGDYPSRPAASRARVWRISAIDEGVHLSRRAISLFVARPPSASISASMRGISWRVVSAGRGRRERAGPWSLPDRERRAVEMKPIA